MNLLRVILATVVIFTAGALSGYFVARKSAVQPPAPAGTQSVLSSTNAPPDWNERRKEMQASLQKELDATDKQMAKVDEILSQSRKRTRDIWSQIKIPLEEEVRRVQEEIRGVLTPEQAAKYEEIMKKRNRFGPAGGKENQKVLNLEKSGSQACRVRPPADHQQLL